jgi:hypothetical protein
LASGWEGFLMQGIAISWVLTVLQLYAKVS